VRAGKTIASLIAFLIALAETEDHALVILAGRTLQTIERNLLDPLQDPALFGPIAKHVQHTRGASTANILGKTVHLLGAADARAEGKLRGLTASLMLIDEATLIPEAFWTMALSRLSVPNARLLATSNPDGPAHWLRQKFLLREGELDLRSWHFTLDDNPALDPVYVEALKREYVGLWYRRFIEGAWCLAEGAVFDMWDEARHVVDILPPILRWVGLGVDYGSVNPFAALLLGLGAPEQDGKQRLYFVDEWRWDSKLQRRQLTDHEYSQRLRDWLGQVPIPHTELRGVRPEWTVVDPSAASFRTQLYQDGLTPTLGDNRVLDGIRLMSSLLATNRLKVARSCKGFIEEIPGYSWNPDKAEKGEDVPIKADDHSLDGARYVTFTTQPTWRHQLREAA
jgi:PBSX family phage terminase large subunit